MPAQRTSDVVTTHLSRRQHGLWRQRLVDPCPNHGFHPVSGQREARFSAIAENLQLGYYVADSSYLWLSPGVNGGIGQPSMSDAILLPRLKRCLAYSALLLVALSGVATAEPEANTTDTVCTVPTLRTDVRPDPVGVPTNVRVGIRAVDVREIDDVDQTITIDLAIRRVWTDPRLSHLEGCRLQTESIWFPELILANSGRLFERWGDRVTIKADGEATHLQRVSGTIASYHSLHDFPFDHQSIEIHIMPLEHDPTQVTLMIDEEFTGIGQRLNISDWSITGYGVRIAESHLLAFAQTRASIAFSVNATRIRAFWLWKVILPLSLIVFMSWCVFWIDPERYGSQIGLSATSMLTIIAFIFATTNMLPALGYFTRLDAFIAGATVLVFLSLIVSLTTSYLVGVDERGRAKRLDRICRIVFPIAFAAFAAIVFLPVL